MSGQFVVASQVQRDALDWGDLGWMTNPAVGAQNLTVLEVILKPGKGHNFHKHPDQEETIYVIEGEVEQWLEQNNKILKSGDAIFIGAGVVHASFNVGSGPAKLLAILGPCVGASGYEVTDVSGEAPWNTLR